MSNIIQDPKKSLILGGGKGRSERKAHFLLLLFNKAFSVKMYPSVSVSPSQSSAGIAIYTLSSADCETYVRYSAGVIGWSSVNSGGTALIYSSWEFGPLRLLCKCSFCH